MTKKPFSLCTLRTAWSITPITAAEPSGVRKPVGEQRAAAGLGGAGQQRVALARLHAHRVERLARRVGAVAAEPAEQLLGAVGEEDGADRGAEDGDAELHDVPSGEDYDRAARHLPGGCPDRGPD